MRFTPSIQRLPAHGSHFRLFPKHGNHAASLLNEVFSECAHTHGSMCRCICSSSERLSVALCFDLMSGHTDLFKSSEGSMIDAAQPLCLMNGYTMLAIRGQKLVSTAWKKDKKMCVKFLCCSRLTLPSCCERWFLYEMLIKNK